MFLKGKMRKSGGTNVPPLSLVEYNTLRAALVKGGRRRSARAKAASSSTRPRRVVSSKGRIKERLLFLSAQKRLYEGTEKKRNRESAETEVVTKRID